MMLKVDVRSSSYYFLVDDDWPLVPQSSDVGYVIHFHRMEPEEFSAVLMAYVSPFRVWLRNPLHVKSSQCPRVNFDQDIGA